MSELQRWSDRYKFLLLFLLFASAAFFVEKNAEKWQNREIPVEKFQKVLWQKETEADEMIDNIERLISTKGLPGFIAGYSDNILEFTSEKGISFLVFENDTLKYWSNNEIAVGQLFSTSGFQKRLIRYPNSWHVAKVKDFNERKVVALILIKSQYTFENAFLKNEFQKSFGKNLRAKISDEKTEKLDIYGKDGTYLFTLHQLPPVEIDFFNSFAALLYFLAVAFLMGFILKWFRWLVLKTSISRNIFVVITSALLVLLRYLMLKYSLPDVLTKLPLFDPYHYAKSFWFPSLGDFYINSFFLLFIAYLFYREFDYARILKLGIKPFICLFFTTFFISLYYLFFHYLLNGLIFNSSVLIEVYNVFYPNFYTLVGYLGIAFLLASLVIFIDKFISIYSGNFTFWKFTGLISFFILLVFIPFMIADKAVTVYQLLFLFAIVFSVSYFRLYRKKYTYSNKIFMVFLLTVFTLFFLAELSVKKEKNIRKVMAVNLANERDQVAEFLLEDIEVKLKTDTTLSKMIKNPAYIDHELFEYLDNAYFSRYFRKYEMQIATCGVEDDLFLEDFQNFVDCYDFFSQMLEDHGVNIYPGSDFYYLDNQNGRISYLGSIVFKDASSLFERKLYISLDSKLMTEQLGYPELLLEGKFGRTSPLVYYSYAKYFKEKLISRSGSYSYALEFNYLDDSHDEMVYFGLNGYSHLIYKVGKDNIIVLSKQEVKIIDLITSFSYLFVFYFLLFSLFVLLTNYKPVGKHFRYNFKNKLKYAMIGVLLLSLIIVGVGTIYYNIAQFQKKHHENISEKIQSVLIELEHKLMLEDKLNEDLRAYVTGLLIKFSNVFYTDINLFDLNGNLYASSRPEVFELGLTGTRIDPVAYKEMYINKSAKFIHNENIGNLSFVSAYVPFSNANYELLAYLNLPYFTRQDVLKREIYTLVVAVTNIYALLILLTIMIALVITNRITEPLRLIQDKLRLISLSKNNEQLIYKGDDEIGGLIKDYNRMVSELGKSAELLAKSEREFAWREMAKQIAHEIKNPLTPMKLSLQHLQRAWDDKVENWDEILEKTTRTLVEQIDTLSKISSEFSLFAQMPRATNEKVNIVHKMKDVISLFVPVRNTEITYNTHGMEELFVFIDKEQLSRVFINLLKNALQSIPKNRDGSIHIDISSLHGKIRVKISDNGKGVSPEQQPRMFQPNFTTKTSGMGLGLAIVKNIVENSGGNIRYETEADKGSSFIFDLPEYDVKYS